MFGFLNKKESKAQAAQAKAEMFFEKYTQEHNHSFTNKSTRLVIAHALRKHIEQVLFDGVEAGQEFKEKKVLAVLHSNVDEPEKPSSDNPYQLIVTKAGPMTSFLPPEISSEVFDFGVSLSNSGADGTYVKEQLQIIMNELASRLGISVEMEVLADINLENV
jgi:hypothetical protein